MKICIIHINQTPPPSPTIEEAPKRFIRHITPFLDLTVDWSVIRLFGDDMPAVRDYDGYLITGGSAPMISKVIPETQNLLAFIRDVYDAKIPLVGICWGHQAICKALGGDLDISEKGYGMGLKQTQVIKHFDWMQYTPDVVNLYSMHRCQVTIPPKDALLFLTSDFCKYAGFVFGNHVLTLQQHPDYNLAVSEAMINRRQDKLSKQQLKIARESLHTAHHTEIACQWVGNFFAQHRK